MTQDKSIEIIAFVLLVAALGAAALYFVDRAFDPYAPVRECAALCEAVGGSFSSYEPGECLCSKGGAP